VKQSKGTFIVVTACILILLVGGAIYKLNLFDSSSNNATKPVPSVKADETKEENQTTTIATIDSSMKGQQQTITGTILDRSMSKGHVFLKVKDTTGTISVPIFKDKAIDATEMSVGQKIAVTGEVNEYQGKIEIIPQAPKDLVVMETKESERLTNDDIGQTKTISAEIVSKYVHPKGHIFLTVESENGQSLKVPLFSTLQPDATSYPVHATAIITGKVTEYKGELELVPETLGDVEVTNKKAETVQTRQISSIKSSDRGSQVVVEGMVEQVTEKKGHLFLQLTQDDSQIKAVLFKADNDEIKGRKERIENAMTSRFPIRVVATVDVYQDELELIIDKVLVD